MRVKKVRPMGRILALAALLSCSTPIREMVPRGDTRYRVLPTVMYAPRPVAASAAAADTLAPPNRTADWV